MCLAYSAVMAEGGHNDEMTYTQAKKVGSTYENPWGDGSVPSFMAARHLLTEKNLSQVPGKEVS